MVTEEKTRWGNKSQKVVRLLEHRCKTYRSRRTGKRVRAVKAYAPIAEKVGVTREFVRQVAQDLGIRSLYRVKGRKRR